MSTTMTVLCHKQQLLFAMQHPPGVDQDGKATGGGYGDTVTVSPKAQLQQVPEWIRDTETFKHASKAGLIVELKPVTPLAEAPAVSTAPAPQPETPPAEPEAEVAGLSSGNRRSRRQ